jgi:hypothetical protein
VSLTIAKTSHELLSGLTLTITETSPVAQLWSNFDHGWDLPDSPAQEQYRPSLKPPRHPSLGVTLTFAKASSAPWLGIDLNHRWDLLDKLVQKWSQPLLTPPL